MAKSVSGKSILIINVLILILGMILILIIVATSSPPSGSIQESNNEKYITIDANDITLFRNNSVGIPEGNLVLTVTTYTGPEEKIENARQSFTITQQQRILNIFIFRNDLITVSYSLNNLIFQNLRYTFTNEIFDRSNLLFITQNNILTDQEYIPRNKMKFLVLDELTPSGGLPVGTTINSKTIKTIFKEIDLNDNSNPTVNSQYMYDSLPFTSGGDGYRFRTTEYGVTLNNLVTINDLNPISIKSFNTNRMVVINYDQSGTQKTMLQSCCGSVGCDSGLSGNGSYSELGITSSNLCSASLLI